MSQKRFRLVTIEFVQFTLKNIQKSVRLVTYILILQIGIENEYSKF